jgi:Zn-dependent protease/predicted transcriptional regulator
MKWSWKIGEFAGIGVYMHATFLILVGWIVLSAYLSGVGLVGAMSSLGYVLALFLCVILHEYGHALTARQYGIMTRDITLLPIGGVARLERMPDNPRHELWVALAGPAVNIVIAAGLFLILLVISPAQALTLNAIDGSFIQRLFAVNIFLALFNMIPAFPMDGGRVVRALLATRLEYTRATHIAANLGQALALVFGLAGFFTNPLLMFIALFVWIGAAQESNMAQMKYSLGGIPVSKAMLTDFRVLAPFDTLSHAIDMILAGSQQDFPVVENGRVLGILTRNQLIISLQKQGPQTLVGQVMERSFESADSAEMLETVANRMQECSCHTVPVTRAGQLVGLITMDNIGEFLMIQSALKRPVRA